MSDTINLEEYSNKLNTDYVGFGLYKGRKVKPVHIANGVSRVLCGKVLNNKGIKKIALVVSKKGIPGYSSKEIYEELIDEDRIEDDVKLEDFDATRRVIQKMLDADSGVYIDRSKSDHMLSFSLSSKYFVTNQALYEDAGEFIGQVVKSACPELTDYIVSLMDQAEDPISQLFIPVTNDEVVNDIVDEDLFALLFPVSKRNQKTIDYINSLADSGKCLLHNLQKEPNVFTQLRLFNLFCVFSLFRYIAYLEAFSCDAKIPPILLDFTGTTGSISDASSGTYANIRRCLSRFCSWVYAKILEDNYSIAEVKHMDPPIRKTGSVAKETQDAISSMWKMAQEESADIDDSQVYSIFGRTINNILDREQDFHPGNYLRAVGLLPGLLYPPNSSNNRFVISQDILEMLLMSTVEPGETVSGKTIRERLWSCCGVVIGGTSFEEGVFRESDLNLQADSDALEHNFEQFASTMESLGFADVMADGILQIHLGGV